MNLASGKAELDACPYVSDEAREQLAEASAPPSVRWQSAKAFAKPLQAVKLYNTGHEKNLLQPQPAGRRSIIGPVLR